MPWLGWGRVRALRLNGVDMPLTAARVTFVHEPVVGGPDRKAWQVDAKIAVPWVLELGQYAVEAELDPDGTLTGPGFSSGRQASAIRAAASSSRRMGIHVG